MSFDLKFSAPSLPGSVTLRRSGNPKGRIFMQAHSSRLSVVILVVAVCFASSFLGAADPAAGWRALFDGKTMNGWTTVGEVRWSVLDGALTANPSTQTRPAATGSP